MAALAAPYGFSPATILAMSPGERQIVLHGIQEHQKERAEMLRVLLESIAVMLGGKKG